MQHHKLQLEPGVEDKELQSEGEESSDGYSDESESNSSADEEEDEIIDPDVPSTHPELPQMVAKQLNRQSMLTSFHQGAKKEKDIVAELIGPVVAKTQPSQNPAAVRTLRKGVSRWREVVISPAFQFLKTMINKISDSRESLRNFHKSIYAVVEQIVEQMASERFYLFLHDVASGSLVSVILTGISEKQLAEPIVLSEEEGIAGFVLHTNKIFNISDAASIGAPSILDEQTSFRTRHILAAPLHSSPQAQVHGVVQFLNKHDSDEGFSREDEILAKLYCQLLSSIFETLVFHRPAVLQLETLTLAFRKKVGHTSALMFLPPSDDDLEAETVETTVMADAAASLDDVLQTKQKRSKSVSAGASPSISPQVTSSSLLVPSADGGRESPSSSARDGQHPSMKKSKSIFFKLQRRESTARSIADINNDENNNNDNNNSNNSADLLTPASPAVRKNSVQFAISNTPPSSAAVLSEKHHQQHHQEQPKKVNLLPQRRDAQQPKTVASFFGARGPLRSSYFSNGGAPGALPTHQLPNGASNNSGDEDGNEEETYGKDYVENLETMWKKSLRRASQLEDRISVLMRDLEEARTNSVINPSASNMKKEMEALKKENLRLRKKYSKLKSDHEDLQTRNQNFESFFRHRKEIRSDSIISKKSMVPGGDGSNSNSAGHLSLLVPTSKAAAAVPISIDVGRISDAEGSAIERHRLRVHDSVADINLTKQQQAQRFLNIPGSLGSSPVSSPHHQPHHSHHHHHSHPHHQHSHSSPSAFSPYSPPSASVSSSPDPHSSNMTFEQAHAAALAAAASQIAALLPAANRSSLAAASANYASPNQSPLVHHKVKNALAQVSPIIHSSSPVLGGLSGKNKSHSISPLPKSTSALAVERRGGSFPLSPSAPDAPIPAMVSDKQLASYALHLAFSRSPTPSLLLSSKARIWRANESAIRLLQIHNEVEILSQPLAEFVIRNANSSKQPLLPAVQGAQAATRADGQQHEEGYGSDDELAAASTANGGLGPLHDGMEMHVILVSKYQRRIPALLWFTSLNKSSGAGSSDALANISKSSASYPNYLVSIFTTSSR